MVFHEGEKFIQRKVGTEESSQDLKSMIRSRLRPGADKVIASVPFLIITTVNKNGHVWVSGLFKHSKDDQLVHSYETSSPSAAHTLSVLQFTRTPQYPEDPFYLAHEPGRFVSIIAIDLLERNRYRVNGVFTSSNSSTTPLPILVKEAFGNCPKYIQARRPIWSNNTSSPSEDDYNNEAKVKSSKRLSESQKQLISRLDTFFIGSCHPEVGADTSHRGGTPGFIRIKETTTPNESGGGEEVKQYIMWGDYEGNGMFQTSGNIHVNEQVGLFFIYFDSHDTCQVRGRARHVWESDALDQSERYIQVEVDEVVYVERAFTRHLNFQLLSYSPYNQTLSCNNNFCSLQNPSPSPSTPSSSSSTSTVTSSLLFPLSVTCDQVIVETPEVSSFRFSCSRKIRYLPGQYASLSFPNTSRASGNVIRTFTISSVSRSPDGDDQFWITVKIRDDKSSTRWLHEHVNSKGQLTLNTIDGNFSPFSSLSSDRWMVDEVELPNKLLFISAGVGITPVMAMVRGLIVKKCQNDVIFLHGNRSLSQVPFLSELMEIERSHSKFQNIFALTSEPADDHQKWKGWRGRVDQKHLVDWVADVQEREIFLCGPESFMTSITTTLENIKFDMRRLHSERFDF